jgi:hypothetical protein
VYVCWLDGAHIRSGRRQPLPQESPDRSSSPPAVRPAFGRRPAGAPAEQPLAALPRRGGGPPTDAAAVYPGVLDELIPRAWHHVEQYANNPIEADHGRLKHRLRPMRGLGTVKTAQVVIAGHAFVQNLRRGHYELAADASPAARVAAAFAELVRAI